MNLDVPGGRTSKHSSEVVDAHIGIRVERLAVGSCVDRRPHRLEIVAHNEQRAAGGDGVRMLQIARPSGVRGIAAYCADTRSNAAVSNASSAFASS